MTALEMLVRKLSGPLAEGGWVLVENNKYDRVYELSSNPGTRLQFSRTAFHVIKGNKKIKEFTTNVFLSNYLAEVQLLTKSNL